MRKGSYGYETKHSTYYNEHVSHKTETDVGVGTRQQTIKRCGIVKPDRDALMRMDRTCQSGTCPYPPSKTTTWS